MFDLARTLAIVDGASVNKQTFFKWYSHFRIQEKIIFADSFNRNLVILIVSIEVSPLFYRDIIRNCATSCGRHT